MHPDAEADPHRGPLIVPGGPQRGRTRAEQGELEANDDAVAAPDRRIGHDWQGAGGPLGHHHPDDGEQRTERRADGEGNHQPRRRGCLPPSEPHEREEPVNDHGDPTATPGREQRGCSLHEVIFTATRERRRYRRLAGP